MTLFSRSPLAVALLVAPLVAGRSDGAEPKGVRVEGVVTYTGPLPRPIPVIEAQAQRHLVERDAKTNGLKQAVVWVEGAEAAIPSTGSMKATVRT